VLKKTKSVNPEKCNIGVFVVCSSRVGNWKADQQLSGTEVGAG